MTVPETAKVIEVHNFMKYYDQRRNIPSEDRPVSLEILGNI